MNGSTISNIYLQQERIRPCLQLNDKLMALKLIMFNLQYKKSVFRCSLYNISDQNYRV